MFGAATGNARSTGFSLVLGTETCCKVGYGANCITRMFYQNRCSGPLTQLCSTLEWIVSNCCDSLREASATESWRGKRTCANQFCTGMLQVIYSSFTVPSVSRPCRTSYQSSPFIAISCVPPYSLHAFSHPFRDVATVWHLWSSTPSLPAHFPLDRALHQLAPAVSQCV